MGVRKCGWDWAGQTRLSAELLVLTKVDDWTLGGSQEEWTIGADAFSKPMSSVFLKDQIGACLSLLLSLLTLSLCNLDNFIPRIPLWVLSEHGGYKKGSCQEMMFMSNSGNDVLHLANFLYHFVIWVMGMGEPLNFHSISLTLTHIHLFTHSSNIWGPGTELSSRGIAVRKTEVFPPSRGLHKTGLWQSAVEEKGGGAGWLT